MPSHSPAPINRSINRNDAQIGDKDDLFYAIDSSTILSIDLRNGAGLEIILIESYLHIVIGDVNLPFISRRVIKTGIAIENSAWTLLSLIHRTKVKHAKQNKNNLEIHLNGLKRWQGVIPYTKGLNPKYGIQLSLGTSTSKRGASTETNVANTTRFEGFFWFIFVVFASFYNGSYTANTWSKL